MKSRFIIVSLLAFLPLSALADTSTGAQAQAPQSAVDAGALLPQANSSGLSSTGASSVLQPNASSLQGSASDGSNLSAPVDQSLQAGNTPDSLKVLLGGEADGTPKNLSDNSESTLGGDLIAAAAGILVVCATIIFLRRKVTSYVIPE